MKPLPKQKPGIIKRKIGNEAMLYDTNQKMVHILNETAEIVWDFCNGEAFMEKVEQKLRKSYNFSKDHNLKDDIDQILLNFSQLGLTVR